MDTLRRLGLINTDTTAFTRTCLDKGIEERAQSAGLDILTLDLLGEKASLSAEDALHEVWLRKEAKDRDTERKARSEKN